MREAINNAVLAHMSIILQTLGSVLSQCLSSQVPAGLDCRELILSAIKTLTFLLPLAKADMMTDFCAGCTQLLSNHSAPETRDAAASFLHSLSEQSLSLELFWNVTKMICTHLSPPPVLRGGAEEYAEPLESALNYIRVVGETAFNIVAKGTHVYIAVLYIFDSAVSFNTNGGLL